MYPKARILVRVSTLYLLSASLGTVVAIVRHLPAEFGGFLNGEDVLPDFLTWKGTALSAPLCMFLLHVGFTACTFGSERAHTVGVRGLAVLGAAYLMGQLGEPILYRTITPAGFDPVVAVILLANIAFSLLMLIFGIQAWRESNPLPQGARG